MSNRFMPSYEVGSDPLALAQKLHESGQLSEAESAYQRILRLHPKQFGALHGLGLIALQRGDLEAGVGWIESATLADPSQPDAHLNLADALCLLGRAEQALASFDQALALRPADSSARQGAATVLRGLGRADEARLMLEPILSGKDQIKRGDALAAIGDLSAAANAYELAVTLDPGNLSTYLAWARTLLKQNLAMEALAICDRAAGVDFHALPLLLTRGAVLAACGRIEDSMATLQRAVELHPESASAWNDLGAIQCQLRLLDESMLSFQQALRNDPGHREAVANFAQALQRLRRFEDAALVYERVMQIDPMWPYAAGQLLYCKMMICDWLAADDLRRLIESRTAAGLPAAEPFGMQAYCNDPALLHRCASTYASRVYPDRSQLLPAVSIRPEGRIRIGYVSGEFRQQATSILMVGLLEQHDRTRFEIFAFDNGRSDDSELRERIEDAVDEMVPIAGVDDLRAAALVRDRGIDILVNLNGFFGLERNGLFALRPAPVQVNYLGFPGTMGVPYMDYLIADRWVIPESDRKHYTESVVYLPDSYQANDSLRVISAEPLSRGDLGLPEAAFVFCSFNNTYKLVPEVFDVWMRLLASLPNSVLWLYAPIAEAAEHLSREAAARGVDPRRLVFAEHWPPALHLARLRLADLFLDTWPYNAHTTGSDALWAGLPVLTCTGATFPSRVGASLLSAAGLPELITSDFAQYEARARQLATDPEQLARLRLKLAQNRQQCPLFDTVRFTRSIEAAYESMAGQAYQALTETPPRLSTQGAAS